MARAATVTDRTATVTARAGASMARTATVSGITHSGTVAPAGRLIPTIAAAGFDPKIIALIAVDTARAGSRSLTGRHDRDKKTGKKSKMRENFKIFLKKN